MNTTLFLATKQQYGIVVYKDDNEYGLVLDDGTVEYAEKQYLRTVNDAQGRIRETLWSVAWLQYQDTQQAAEHYSKTLRHWLRKANDAGKTCRECGEFKPFDNFHPSMDTTDGYRGQCRACYALKNAERYKERKARN